MESVLVLRAPMHALAGAFGLLSGFAELAVAGKVPLEKLGDQLEAVRSRWDVAYAEVYQAFARARETEDKEKRTKPEPEQPVEAEVDAEATWQARALHAEALIRAIEQQKDRWLGAGSVCATAAGQTLAHILQQKDA